MLHGPDPVHDASGCSKSSLLTRTPQIMLPTKTSIPVVRRSYMSRTQEDGLCLSVGGGQRHVPDSLAQKAEPRPLWPSVGFLAAHAATLVAALAPRHVSLLSSGFPCVCVCVYVYMCWEEIEKHCAAHSMCCNRFNDRIPMGRSDKRQASPCHCDLGKQLLCHIHPREF